MAISYKELIDSSVAISGTTALARSNAVELPVGSADFALEYKFGPVGGTVEVKMEIEQSNDGVNYTVPDDFSGALVSAANDTDRHIIAFSPRPTRFARILFTALTDNGVTTTIDVLNLSCSANLHIVGE